MNQGWLLNGHLNDILSVSEKRGGVKASTKRCDFFRERVESYKLMDLESSRHRYTWRGPIYQGGVQIYERLDRALCNNIWRIEFLNAYIKVLTRMKFSDHHPILISLKEKDTCERSRRFHFKSVCLL